MGTTGFTTGGMAMTGTVGGTTGPGTAMTGTTVATSTVVGTGGIGMGTTGLTTGGMASGGTVGEDLRHEPRIIHHGRAGPADSHRFRGPALAYCGCGEGPVLSSRVS